jgi:CheY-like chemotaxis protein
MASSKSEILVVEDEEAIRRLLEMVLVQYGFGVRLAGTGTEAVELYEQHRDSIAAVLLDVQMDGLDGPGTLAALQAINPRVRCCFMSGHTRKYTSGQLLAMGAAHVLPKPFSSLNELARTLRAVTMGGGQT